jgi:hypothetical protein
MTETILVCLSNPIFVDKYKIITTNRQPQEELDELNQRALGIIPEKYVLEYFVRSSSEKLPLALTALSDHHCNDGFYNGPLDWIKSIFRLSLPDVPAEVPAENSSDVSSDEEQGPRRPKGPPLSSYARDGQRIRHKNCCPTTWIGIYNASRKSIIRDGIIYRTLSGFGKEHHRAENPNRHSFACNGLEECEIEVSDGIWVKPNTLFPAASV